MDDASQVRVDDLVAKVDQPVGGRERDEHDPDDIDSDSEDHIVDEFRYRILAKPTGRSSRELANY